MKLNPDVLKYASLSAAERDKADDYAGPDKSFPLYADGAHLRAAWDLAGHAADPAAVRARIKAFAREHGLSGHLPKDAQREVAKKALEWEVFKAGVLSLKAKTEDLKSLLQMAYAHEQGEGDVYQQRRLIRFAEDNNLTHLLPDDAHGVMHEMGVHHAHADTPNDEQGNHSHATVKHVEPEPEMAVKAVSSPNSLVVKAWESDGATIVEGWISTPDRDLQKEIYEPEAFVGSIADYMLAGGPHTCEHNTDDYPVGHVQRIAAVRDGAVLKAASHPTDAADFEHFPNSGSGLFARVKYTDTKVGFAVKAGNMRSFSWIGKPVKYDALPDGGRRVTEVYPLLETTSAAFPVNQKAAMVAAKSRGKSRN